MKAVSKPGARVSHPLHVLIVDDSKADAELLLRALLAGGFEASHQLVDTQAAMRTAIEGQEWDVIPAAEGVKKVAAEASPEMCLRDEYRVVGSTVGCKDLAEER
jgi:CheY-like chemotaxis protein